LLGLTAEEEEEGIGRAYLRPSRYVCCVLSSAGVWGALGYWGQGGCVKLVCWMIIWWFLAGGVRRSTRELEQSELTHSWSGYFKTARSNGTSGHATAPREMCRERGMSVCERSMMVKLEFQYRHLRKQFSVHQYRIQLTESPQPRRCIQQGSSSLGLDSDLFEISTSTEQQKKRGLSHAPEMPGDRKGYSCHDIVQESNHNRMPFFVWVYQHPLVGMGLW